MRLCCKRPTNSKSRSSGTTDKDFSCVHHLESPQKRHGRDGRASYVFDTFTPVEMDLKFPISVSLDDNTLSSSLRGVTTPVIF